MKKFIRQIISMASILTMLISMVPAYAAPSESTTTSDDQIAESPEVYASPIVAQLSRQKSKIFIMN